VTLSQGTAGIFVPDGTPPTEALARTTHLGIGSHPDDLEIMTWHGIGACLERDDQWFSGVVVTDGAGSPRSGDFAAVSDSEMPAVRLAEQKRAATIGRYGALVHLGFASRDVKAADCSALIGDLAWTISAARPQIVYTHSLFDAHDTHVAVALHVIRAIRTLPAHSRPAALYGGEVWRSLDWLPEGDRVSLDVSSREAIGAALLAVYESQIAGGKRYDEAALGRRRANATFRDPRDVDRATAIEHAMDLSPLISDDTIDICEWALDMVGRFSNSIADRLRRYLP
jgi:LmbE family N-acetylglucosaminyl deacetylase